MLIGINGGYFPAICRVCLSDYSVSVVSRKHFAFMLLQRLYLNELSFFNINVKTCCFNVSNFSMPDLCVYTQITEVVFDLLVEYFFVNGFYNQKTIFSLRFFPIIAAYNRSSRMHPLS